MRAASVLSLILFATCATAQETEVRYNVALDAKAYPQATAKQALTSVLKAAADKKVDYVVAHLADPSYVDDRVKRIYGGKFAEQVDDTRTQLDPFALKTLKRFLDDGKWTEGKAEVVVTLDDVKGKQVKLVKKGERWYLANATK